MTKTLTEQIVRIQNGLDIVFDKVVRLEKRLEVSEKAHYKTLEQLRIATKALKDILNDGDDYWDKDKAQEALTKMKGVK